MSFDFLILSVYNPIVMSVEAPKGPNRTAHVTPKEPQGYLPGLLRSFAIKSGSQPGQPPPGLEGFAARLQEGIDGHLSAQRQLELDRRSAETSRRVIEADKKARDAQIQREIADQDRTNRESAVIEASRVLQDFQIEQRLKIIQQTVWERKGKIRTIDPDLSLGVLGGLELIHEYPSHTRKSEGDLCRGRWKYIPTTDSTALSVLVKNGERFKSGGTEVVYKPGMFLRIESLTSGGDTKVAIPIDAEDSRTLLEATLLQDSQNRLANQGRGLPSQLEEASRKAQPKFLYWNALIDGGWTSYYNPDYDPSGPD